MSSLEDLEKRIKALEDLKGKKEPVEKKDRPPRELSEYNKFIQKKIAEIKKKDPKISHRDAFADATKEWSTFKKSKE